MSRVRTRGRNGPELGQIAVEQTEDKAGNWLRPLPSSWVFLHHLKTPQMGVFNPRP